MRCAKYFDLKRSSSGTCWWFEEHVSNNINKCLKRLKHVAHSLLIKFGKVIKCWYNNKHVFNFSIYKDTMYRWFLYYRQDEHPTSGHTLCCSIFSGCVCPSFGSRYLQSRKYHYHYYYYQHIYILLYIYIYIYKIFQYFMNLKLFLINNIN